VISGRSFSSAVFWTSTESNEDKRELRYRSARGPVVMLIAGCPASTLVIVAVCDDA
jgi:hypothetical protein